MNATTLTTSLPKLVDLIESVRKLDSDMPAQTLFTLLLVAQAGEEGILQHELGMKLGLTKASTSRNVLLLSQHKGVGIPGLGLVDADIEAENRRHRRVKLTAKGQRFIEKLVGIIA